MSLNVPIDPNDSQGDFKPFEAALGSLIPATSRIDRDRLMYLAGAASAAQGADAEPTTMPPKQTWRQRTYGAFWPLAAAALLLVSISLGAFAAFREPRERVVYIERQLAQQSPSLHSRTASGALPLDIPSNWIANRAPLEASYLVLRGQVLQRGAAALDCPVENRQFDERHVPSNRALLNELLGG